MSVVLLCALIVAVAAAPPKGKDLTASYTFEHYVRDFHKEYAGGAVEHEKRRHIFESNLGDIIRHNAQSGRTYTMGVNRFTDQTEEEYRRLVPPMPHHNRGSLPHAQPFIRSQATGPRVAVDYRNSVPAILTGVKDQGYCGSCWAFATTESVETYWALATGKLWVLSPQQLVSCVPKVEIPPLTMYGCDGYFPEYAYEYLAGAGGLTEEFVFPYTSYFTGNGTVNTSVPCHQTYPVASVAGYVQLPPNDQSAVEQVLSDQGPLSVVIFVIKSFMAYESGVFSDPKCVSDNMGPSHVVQLVGYGHDDDLNVDYWIVRNSWTPAWGENGYVRILKTAVPECGVWPWPYQNRTGWGNFTACGECGILTTPLFPVVGSP